MKWDAPGLRRKSKDGKSRHCYSLFELRQWPGARKTLDIEKASSPKSSTIDLHGDLCHFTVLLQFLCVTDQRNYIT